MTDQTNKERTIRDAFEDSRRQGLNTDWFTFQIAWSYADAALSASAPAMYMQDDQAALRAAFKAHCKADWADPTMVYEWDIFHAGYRAANAPAAGSAPSDEEIQAVAESMRMQPWGIGSRQEDAIAYGRALLAQYGSPAWQPIETAPKDGEVVLVRGHEFGNANLPRFVALATYIHGEFHNEEGAQVKPDQWMRIDAEN